LNPLGIKKKKKGRVPTTGDREKSGNGKPQNIVPEE